MLIKSDPDKAIRLAQMAGVLLVLSPAAKAQIPKLKAMMADRGDGGGYYVDGSPDEGDWQIGVDFGSFDFSADVGSWLDTICSVGDFTGGDAGGDGGGDGGGGD